MTGLFISSAIISIFVSTLYNCSAYTRYIGLPSRVRFTTSIYESVPRWSPPEEKPNTPPGAVVNEYGGLIYSVEMTKRAGINWGTDLSFRWVYVSSLESTGQAALDGIIQKGDYIIGMGNDSMIAQDFDYVLTNLQKQPSPFNYTFFRGTKEQLLGDAFVEPSKQMYKVRVKQDNKPDVLLDCPGGSNIRKLLVGNGINVYRSIARWTNCSGKQRCGTCIIEVEEGLDNCSRRSLDEEQTLRENPDSYRLSCVTSVYGDVTVKIQGPVGAAQWTR